VIYTDYKGFVAIMMMNCRLLYEQTGKLAYLYLREARGIYYRLFVKDKIAIKLFPDMQVELYSKGDIAEIAFKDQVLLRHEKSFEYTTLKKFRERITAGDVVIDVGANIGIYSLFFSKLVGKNGRVFAFEPDAATGQLFLNNIALNDCKNVQFFNLALSDESGPVRICGYNPQNLRLTDGDSFKYITKLDPDEVNKQDLIAQAVKLDDIEEIVRLEKLDYIKIDVEGAELLVLRGAMDTIRKHKPVILFELSEKWVRRFSYKTYQALIFLNELGYELEQYDIEQWIATPAS